MEQKGPSHTSVMTEASFISSPLGQPSSWRRMDNTKVLTLAQFVSLTVRADSGKTVKSLKFICMTIHFPVSHPPSFVRAFLSAQLNKPPTPTSLCLQNVPFIAAFFGLSSTLPKSIYRLNIYNHSMSKLKESLGFIVRTPTYFLWRAMSKVKHLGTETDLCDPQLCSFPSTLWPACSSTIHSH